jgi:DNA-binding response OmpR family regulator
LASEDDPALRTILTEVLEEEVYAVAFMALHDLAAVVADSPDVLLLDGRGLAGETGWAYLERLKAEPATAATPILVLTGLGKHETDPRLPRLAELDTVLVIKPFDLNDLIAQVRRRLAGESA